MERARASRAVTWAAAAAILGLAVALAAVLRGMPIGDTQTANWIRSAWLGTLAAASAVGAVSCLVSGLRSGRAGSLLRAGAMGGLAGAAVTVLLADGSLLIAAAVAAGMLLAGAVADRAGLLLGDRSRLPAAAGLLLIAELAALGGLAAPMDRIADFAAPVLVGGAIVAGVAAVLRQGLSDAAFGAGIAAMALARAGGPEELVAITLLAVGGLLAVVDGEPVRRARPSHSAQELPDLAAQLPDGVLRFDGGLQLRDWNRAAADLLGLREEATGTRIEDLLGISLAELPPNDDTARHSGVGGIEMRVRRDDGGVTVVVREPGASVEAERLGHELRGTIEELLHARRTIELQRAEIERASTIDPLTGVASRGAILERLRVEVAQARRYAHPVAVVNLDVDGFTAINHEHGLAGGDAVLREVALRIRLRVRDADAIGRAGSDGFLAVLPHTDEAGAATFADALRRRLAQRPVHVGPHQLSVTVSAGVAVMRPGEEVGVDGILQRADEALTSAREAGGDRIALDRLHGLARLETHRPADDEAGEMAQDTGI